MANTKITSRVIADDAVLTANIVDANVTTAKIADDAVTAAKLANDIAISTTGDLTVTSSTSNKPVVTIKNTNADASAPQLVFNKDSSSPADNDEVGRIYMYGDDDGGNAFEAVLIRGIATDVSNGSEDSTLEFFTYSGGSQTSTLALASGNVGIGETSPQGALHVKSSDSGATASSSADEIVVENSGNSGISILSGASASGSIYFGDSGLAYDGYIQYDQSNRKFNFITAGGGGGFHLDSVGNAKLSGGDNNEVYMDIFSDSGTNRGGGYFRFLTDGSSAEQSVAQIYMEQGSGDGAARKCHMYFQVSDNGAPTTAMTISNNKRVTAHSSLLVGQTSDTGMSGNGIESAGSLKVNNFILSTDLVGSGFRNLNANASGTITTSTSLRELKENIVDMSLGLSDVLKLKPREFNWKNAEEHGTEDIGFIADEVFDVSPKLATYKVGDKTKDNLQGVKYDTMTSLLVKAIQELSAEVEELKAKLESE